MDESRRQDLAELSELYKRAQNSFQRSEYERVARKIMNENGAVRARREELIEALRKNDRRKVRYIQEELRVMDKNRTGGRETLKV